MNDQNANVTPEPEEQNAGVPQAVADDVAAVAAELDAFARGASRGWKISAIGFLIILAIIAGYLKFFVYNMIVVGFTEPDILFQTGIGVLEQAMGAAGMPTLDSGQLPRWMADRAKDYGVTLINDQIKPQVLDLKAQLPQKRRELVAQAKAQLPGWIDDGISRLETELVPDAIKSVSDELSGRLDEVLDQLDEQLNQLVDQLLQIHGDKILAMQEDDEVAQAVEKALEQNMGYYLDQVFKKVDPHIANAADALEDLVQSKQKTDQQRLELRIIQLVYHMYGKFAVEDKGVKGATPKPGEAQLRGPAMPPLEEILKEMSAEERKALDAAVQKRMDEETKSLTTADGKPVQLSDEEKAALRKTILEGLVQDMQGVGLPAAPPSN